jgi:hypothetical protein
MGAKMPDGEKTITLIVAGDARRDAPHCSKRLDSPWNL